MGAWGTGLYSSDSALDVKDTYLNLLGNGLPDDEALERVLKDAPKPNDEDECEFWLALASIQWKYGRLDEDVKKKALEIIASGGDVDRWKETGKSRDVQKRKGVIEAVRKQLVTEMPPRKKVKEEYYPKSPWKNGEVILYKISEKESNGNLKNKWVALHIIFVSTWVNKSDGIKTESDHVSFMLFSWVGEDFDISVDTFNQLSYIPLFNSHEISGKIKSANLDWSSISELKRFQKRVVSLGYLAVPDYVCKGGYYDRRFKLNNIEQSLIALINENGCQT